MQTPGPGSYKTIVPSLYMRRDPAYSLAGRFELIVDKSVKPGPGAYYPEKVGDVIMSFSLVQLCHTIVGH